MQHFHLRTINNFVVWMPYKQIVFTGWLSNLC